MPRISFLNQRNSRGLDAIYEFKSSPGSSLVDLDRSCHAGILFLSVFYRKISVQDGAFAIRGKHMADIVLLRGTSFRDSRGATAALMTPAAR